MKKRFELFEYQKQGVQFLLSRDRALLCDEMGCGKSVQVLEGIEQLAVGKDKLNVLVICPAALGLMWLRSSEEWLGDAGEYHHLKSVKKIEFSKKIRVCVCSYNFIQSAEKVSKLKELAWDVIVCDEMHSAKNWKSKTARGLEQLLAVYKGKFWGLTGTPATRSGQDYYTYLRLIKRGAWNKEITLKKFSDTFCNREYNPWSGGFNYTGVRDDKKKELREVFAGIALRRRKEQVLQQLPSKIIQELPVAVDPSIVAECLTVDEETVRAALEKGGALPAHIMKVLRSVGMGKVDSACEIIESAGEPIVVMAIHHDVVDAICERFKGAVRVTGVESGAEKDAAVQKFQGGEADIIVCNTAAGGVGITLTRASRMLFVEMSWSPAVMRQAEDRIHRIGAKQCCNIIRLVAEKTLDKQIIDTLKYKEKFMKAVLGDTL